MIRKILFAALLVAPLAWTPAEASAQERGPESAPAASANAPACPPGMANRPAGKALPPGVAARFPGCTAAPAPEPEPEDPPEEEECTTFDPITGLPVPCTEGGAES